MATIETTSEMVNKVYSTSRERLQKVRARLNRPLTLAEKVLFGHLDDPQGQELERGKSFLLLRPDRVAMQDATAQMAMLQFMLAGKSEAAVPSTVHCDHLITAHKNANADLVTANSDNSEVYDFLASSASRYHLGFWKPGAGIIHQVVLENYAFPGGLMIGTDSHTPNAGGLGMVACGVGGADASDVMAGLPWEVKNPQIIGVHLKGKMNGWTSGKDVILKLLGILTTKGGTDKIIEYFGEGCDSISATGKATITNMGAELGATCSIFPYDDRMGAYLKITNRSDLAALADANRDLLCADAEVTSSSESAKKYFDQVIEIDLTTLEPHLVGPHSPDIARPISKMAEEVKANGWPAQLSAALIGSCTNSSYEDIGRASFVAQQALDHGVKMGQPFLVSPGSTQIQKTIERDGQMKVFGEVGATVMANACGPCIGQWKRDDVQKGTVNTIVTSFNRNFRGRQDSNPETLAFIGSPEVVMALGVAGRIDFNPLVDEIEGRDGKKFKLQPPVAEELPAQGFVPDPDGYQAPQGASVQVVVKEGSERLELLSPFPAWDKNDAIENMPVLCKAKGKCTTDHISPAGKWLRYRGHLDNISNNMLLGATNAFTGEIGLGKNVMTGEAGLEYAQIARDYKKKGVRWCIIGDDNYGEGSSREHAAMSPRHLGGMAVITKSFARIHETNLKKQGALPLMFVNPADYDKVLENDRITLKGLSAFAPGKNLAVEVTHADGSKDNFEVKHTFNTEQIKWFQAGSALNLLRQENK